MSFSLFDINPPVDAVCGKQARLKSNFITSTPIKLQARESEREQEKSDVKFMFQTLCVDDKLKHLRAFTA